LKKEVIAELKRGPKTVSELEKTLKRPKNTIYEACDDLIEDVLRKN